MNKEQFLTELNKNLHSLSAAERKEISQDIEEHFENGIAEGKSEDKIAASLGSPQQIAKEMRASHHVEKVESTASAGNIMRAIWAVIGLGFFNLVIVLGPLVALVAIIASGWAVGVSFVGSPLLVVLNTTIHPEVFRWFDLFFSIGLVGLGLLTLMGMYHATRFFIHGLVRYLKYNVSLVKGGMKNV